MKLKHYALFLSAVFLLASCNNNVTNANKKQEKIITVQTQTAQIVLPYNGTVAPIKIVPIVSPVAGTIKELYFSYGEKIKNGQKLALIRSSALDKNYLSAISTYLTSKEKYNSSKADIISSKELFKAGIISQQQFESAKSSYNDSYLSYIQSLHNLIDILKKTKISQKRVELIKINDPKAVHDALMEPIANLEIFSIADGIALKPIKGSLNSGSSSSDSETLDVGSSIKSDQLLLDIGDITGISISIDIDEIHINQVKVGDKALVTSPVIPGTVLQGVVTAVGSQANSNSGNGGLPTFPVKVEVKNLTAKEQQIIHVGMSAKVELEIIQPAKIMIPITAVFEKNGMPMVKKLNPKTGTFEAVPIKTGATTQDQVTVLDGLMVGDKIVTHN